MAVEDLGFPSVAVEDLGFPFEAVEDLGFPSVAAEDLSFPSSAVEDLGFPSVAMEDLNFLSAAVEDMGLSLLLTLAADGRDRTITVSSSDSESRIAPGMGRRRLADGGEAADLLLDGVSWTLPLPALFDNKYTFFPDGLIS